MTIIEQIRKELFELNQKYIDEADDNYDFWNNHIKYVVSEAVNLAKTHNADLEIVELGAILHDIALVAKVGTKVDHNTNGAKLAKELLTKYNYPQDKMDLVGGIIGVQRRSVFLAVDRVFRFHDILHIIGLIGVGNIVGIFLNRDNGGCTVNKSGRPEKS